jgi:hypothetical protein
MAEQRWVQQRRVEQRFSAALKASSEWALAPEVPSDIFPQRLKPPSKVTP